MKDFTFPALAAGPPSRRNWYKELLDDPACNGDAHRVQEAYETHRKAYFITQVQTFANSESNPVTPDQALIKYLARQKKLEDNTRPPATDDTNSQDINCCVIWARPSPPILSLIQSLQTQLASLIGPDLHLIPLCDIHLSVIELSHRHSVAYLRSTVSEIGHSRIQTMLDMISALNIAPGLTAPRLNIDKMGVALSFTPTAEKAYTYHHLRSDMHALALESGVSIDMCYTAPSAHITLGRFVGNAFFESMEGRKQFLGLVEEINAGLGEDGSAWAVGEEQGLELQLGYLKFGRARDKADMVGQPRGA